LSDIQNALGSVWHRWDPHIHAPGTVLADNFGDDAWENYLIAIEAAQPPIRALGVTDYYSVEGYQQVLAHKKAGRLPGVDLTFLNIEMRFGIGTGRNHPINFHLLVSPEDDDHVELAARFMRQLTFRAHEENFSCERGDLIRLGRLHLKDSKADPKAALAAGANQFKVDLANLKDAFEKSEWARKNILVAVASTEGDGTAGLQGDSSLTTLRKEIEKFADVIFGSSGKMRDFWLGLGAATPKELADGWGGPRPCLHGCDAHDLAKVGKPTNDLYTWIKGDLTFEALRQAILEPASRAFVGPRHPVGALPSEVITQVEVTNAPWFANGTVPLNAGLVAIIGARGSGKTALAEVIAAGAFAARPPLEESERKSFLHRAAKYLGTARATLNWMAGNPTYNDLRGVGIEELLDSPRVRYLSQQFVDALCSAEGVTDELLAEIERVVFQAHPEEDRMEASNFSELLEFRAERARNERGRQEDAIGRASAELGAERQRRDALPVLKKQRDEAAVALAKDKADRQALLGKTMAESGVSARLEEVAAVAALRRTEIQSMHRRRQSLLALQDEVKSVRAQTIPALLHELREAHYEAGLNDAAWTSFELAFKGDPESVIVSAIGEADRAITRLKGPPVVRVADDAAVPTESLLMDGVELKDQALSYLDAEISRLTRTVGIASENAKAYARLSEKITASEAGIAKLERQIAQGEAAAARIETLLSARADHYQDTFAAIVSEEEELSALYAPLKAQIDGQPGALGRLTFNVRRTADAKAWADRGETLLDTRKTGLFRGKGALLAAVQAELSPAWETGSAEDVGKAMAAFRAKHDKDFVEQALEDRSSRQRYREWAAQLSAWLYSTDHIRIRYSIQYDGVEIERLSPGTRGIVLLLLYLSIDRTDDRPLIIDQPEENLDPKSVFDELVQRFRVAKTRRQIIIVTHNANLVVNSDADQVIVAHAGNQHPGALPAISYVSGGLENPQLRKLVCEILEGGEAAFVERAKRLRIGL
jgi:AAA domain, putative AbiEii toxin, Type IV TA system